ncbi:hypothetical protein EV643_106199 [Kribbella sp. VKM Ac-2527]|uniref:Uncharacterized protein n=1 Tax=Kribbella caucasensis TaxID=2512215 RepID=A0A4R6KHT9_9ACTN|nr:hypothetical protein [Kribbella sp. VKM Ac-2527]TDO49230.1 hypothetical protein EV643_106199 [Kribbella sp. VKM Ac-2527]
MVNVPAVNVLPELGTAGWTSDQAVMYEIAQEGVRQAIGYYAQLIGAEEAAAEPDADAIAGWRAEQEAWAARGQELTPMDSPAVKRTRADAYELLSEDEDEDDAEDADESEVGADDLGDDDDDDEVLGGA